MCQLRWLKTIVALLFALFTFLGGNSHFAHAGPAGLTIKFESYTISTGDPTPEGKNMTFTLTVRKGSDEPKTGVYNVGDVLPGTVFRIASFHHIVKDIGRFPTVAKETLKLVNRKTAASVKIEVFHEWKG